MKKTKRLISLFLSVFMFLSITAGIEFSAHAETTGSQIVAFAKTLEGCSYRYNGCGPKCFDCSGFVKYVFNHFGYTVPNSTVGYSNYSQYGTKITDDSKAKLADIVVWNGHVGIYIGNGKVVNALGTKFGVCETDIKEFVNSSRVKNPSHYYVRIKGVSESLKNPSVKTKTPTNVTATSAKLSFTVSNPSKVEVKKVGVQVRKKGTKDWKSKTKTVASNQVKAASVSLSCTVGSGKELNTALASNTTYEYRAFAVYNKKKFYSSVSTFKTPIINPSVTVQKAENVTANSAKLTFKVSNPSKVAITKYSIQVRKKGATEWRMLQEDTNSKNKNVSSFSVSKTVGRNKAVDMQLEPATAYEYKASIVYNCSYYQSKVGSFTTASKTENVKETTSELSEEAVAEKPAQKQVKTPKLSVAVNGNGSFKLSWNKVEGANQYGIYLKNADGSYKLLKTTTALSYTTSVATYGKNFAYAVRAFRTIDSKNSFVSNYCSAVKAVNNKKLQTPTMKAKVNSNGAFNLSWNKIAGADKYKVYVQDSNGKYKLYKTVSGTSFTTMVETYNKQFSYKVKAVNSKKNVASACSKIVKVKNTKKLQAPSNVKVSLNQNGTFKITWNKVSGADQYEVCVLESGAKNYKLVKTTSSNQLTTRKATKGVTYKYKVKALKKSKSSVTSAYSSVVSKKR
ncbi:MAG: C40 family peptidase [Eubacterium sp.]|nr:C40 family peptidase [Eubacterium sp.]